jgi:uncharacterized protein (UPF0216 family)
MESDKFTTTALREDLRRLNSHLPRSRRPLDELLAEDSPNVTSVSGHLIKMKKQELVDLSSSIPNLERSKIRLPIILLRRTDLGPGAFVVLGDPYEEYAVSVLSGSFSRSFDEFSKRGSTASAIYKPQVSLLLRRFHSLITIGFGTTSGNG